MKKKWLNLVLRLTNRIYVIKQYIVEKSGLVVVKNVFILLCLEFFLAIVSLPLYLGLKSRNVVAFMEESGVYASVSFDYNFRRILTLSGVSIVLVALLIKLIFIVSLPIVHGPLNLHEISGFVPADIATESLVVDEIGIQSAIIDESFQVPKLAKIDKAIRGDFVFSGTGKPFSTVVLLLSDKGTVIYSTEVAKDGTWQVDHLQNKFKLSEGNHSVLVFAYDKESDTKSNVSS